MRTVRTTTIACALLGAVVLITMCATSATAIVVVWKSANAQVIENATPTFVIEDPPVGTMYDECRVLEWRDADSLGAPDWTPTGTVSGSTTQAWLRDATAKLTTMTTVSSDGVIFNLEGDSNDGRCDLFVDGFKVATLDMWDAGTNRVLVVVRGLPTSVHMLVVDDIGATTQPGGTPLDDDIAVWGASAADCADVPTLSEWGLIVLMLLLLGVGTVVVTRQRKGFGTA